jgi:predicted site-specific integrase-resolvase
VAAISRVSSQGQSVSRTEDGESDLARQKQRVREYIEENYPGAKVTEFARVAGGLHFEDETLKKLCLAIMHGDFDVCVCLFHDRLVRFGHPLISFMCEFSNTKLVYINTQSEDSNTLIVSECLEVLTHYTAVISGNKTKLLHKVYMDAELLRRTWRLWMGGRSIRSIVEQYKAEGLTDPKGRAYTKHVVWTLLQENKEVLEQLYGRESEPTSFSKFVEKHVVRSAEPTDTVSKKEMVKRYQEFCAANPDAGEYDNSNRASLIKYGYSRKLDASRNVFYIGVKLV